MKKLLPFMLVILFASGCATLSDAELEEIAAENQMLEGRTGIDTSSTIPLLIIRF